MQVHPQQLPDQSFCTDGQQQYIVINQQQQQQYVSQQYVVVPQINSNQIVGQIVTQQPEFIEIKHEVDLTSMAMQYFNIPDQVFFEHFFEKLRPCWSGRWADRSIFNVPGIGTLAIGRQYERQCRCYWTTIPQKYRRKIKSWDNRGFCNSHFFAMPQYIVDNGLIELEYWNKCGIVTAAGIPIIKYQDSVPNCFDALCGHCGSGYPKVTLHFLLEQNKDPLIIVPETSSCPETTFSLCAPCSICGVCQSERQFKVEGLTQGTCQINNSRTCSDACAKVCQCQGSCGCPNVDYPHFKVHFLNVVPVDKLAILLGLVHFNMIKKWYNIAVVQYQVVGLA